MNNLIALEKFERVLLAMREQFPDQLADVTLTPSLFPNLFTLNCSINNLDSEHWLTEYNIIETASKMGALFGLGISPGSIMVSPRDAALFKPYTEVEVLDFWLAEPGYREDALCRDAEAARMLVRCQPDALWGWIPGHVLETIGQQVKVRLARTLFRAGAPAGQFVSLDVNSWGLRLWKATPAQRKLG